MNDEHGSHGTASIVKDPFLGVLKVGRDGVRVSFGQLVNDGLDNVRRVGLSACCELVGVSDGAESSSFKLGRVKDVEAFLS